MCVHQNWSHKEVIDKPSDPGGKMQDVPVSHVRRTRREMSATSEETSNDGGGSNMCFKTDEADMSGVSCARLSSRPESDYWKGFSTSTYSHSRSNHVAFALPQLRLRSGADPLSVVQDISKGCQAKASQQPESLSRNSTFSFQTGEAKLNVSYLEDVLENDLLRLLSAGICDQ